MMATMLNNAVIGLGRALAAGASAENAPPAAATPPATTVDEAARPVLDRVAEAVLFVGIDVGIVLVALAIMACLWRVLRGPTLADRGLASDAIAIMVAGLVMLLTIRFATLVVFDVVLIVSVLGFVSTMAIAQFIGRRRSVT